MIGVHIMKGKQRILSLKHGIWFLPAYFEQAMRIQYHAQKLYT